MFVPSSIIAVVNQLSPIITVALAYFILKEVIKCFDMSIMGVNFAAILITIFGADANADSGLASPKVSIYVIYSLMLVNPFFSAGGTIAMRKMKKFSEYVVSWYLNWSIGLTSLALLGITMGPTMFDTFFYFDW